MIDDKGDTVRFDETVGGGWSVLYTGDEAPWRTGDPPAFRSFGSRCLAARGTRPIVDRDGTRPDG